MACVIYESCPNGSDRFPVTDSPSQHAWACGGPRFRVRKVPDVGSCANKYGFINEAAGLEKKSTSLGKAGPSGTRYSMAQKISCLGKPET